jgi:hypothetical protein
MARASFIPKPPRRARGQDRIIYASIVAAITLIALLSILLFRLIPH